MTLNVVLGLLVLIVLWVIIAYNRFVSLNNRTGEAWSDITVQLKRRHDLIPNIVTTVQGYAKHEKQAFENVTAARAKAMGAQGITDKGDTENALTGAIKTVIAVAEAYPDLKANQNFLALQAELAETENKIMMARRYYNGNVRDFNTSVQSFPGNVLAGMFKFSQKEFFKLDDASEANVPEVKV
jgi:LemA protein